MRPSTPSLESAREAWLAAEQEEDFWREHYGQYREEYPDQFVAVTGGKVIAASPDLRHLIGILQGMGMDVRRSWVRYIAATPRRLAI